MYKLTKLFLKINKWVALGVACLAGISLLVDVIRSIVDASFRFGIVSGAFTVAAGLFSFFFASKKAIEGFDAAKCPADAKTPAIWAIVSGALCGAFGIPAGIFMFIMKDAHYAEAAAEASKADDKKAE